MPRRVRRANGDVKVHGDGERDKEWEDGGGEDGEGKPGGGESG